LGKKTPFFGTLMDYLYICRINIRTMFDYRDTFWIIGPFVVVGFILSIVGLFVSKTLLLAGLAVFVPTFIMFSIDFYMHCWELREDEREELKRSANNAKPKPGLGKYFKAPSFS
jgi:hypothetical protein